MALRNIVYTPDPVLLKRSKEVYDFDERLWQLLDDMKQTMENSNGVGLAAVQVGVLKRVIIVSINNLFLEIINPEIIRQDGTQCGVEGCLSIKDIQGYVERPKTITVKGFDRYANKIVLQAENELAVVICHETDHVNGILFTSKMVKEYFPEEDKQTQ